MQNEKPLKQVIKEFVEHYRLETKLNEFTLIDKWEEVVGKMIAKHTTKLKIEKRTLFIDVDSSIVRNELSMIKTAIITRMNAYFKKPLIDKIVLN